MNKSPCCNAELEGYRADVYPYESGYKCTCCGAEFSNLQIARGALENPCEPWGSCKHPTKHNWEARRRAHDKKALEDYMRTPRDITNNTLEEKANTLTLHFIGFVSKPLGISEEVYEKCLEARQIVLFSA